MDKDIDVRHDGPVDIITIDRPDVRNALRFQSYDELESAVRQSRARAIEASTASMARRSACTSFDEDGESRRIAIDQVLVSTNKLNRGCALSYSRMKSPIRACPSDQANASAAGAR